MSDKQKGPKFKPPSDSEKKRLAKVGKDNIHVKLDKIQPQKGGRRTGVNRAWRLEKELVEKRGKIADLFNSFLKNSYFSIIFIQFNP